MEITCHFPYKVKNVAEMLPYKTCAILIVNFPNKVTLIRPTSYQRPPSIIRKYRVKKSPFIYIIVILISVGAFAFEADNFTERYKPLKDSIDPLNDEVNRRLEEVTERLKTHGCDHEDLQEATKGFFGGFIIGSLEEFSDDNPNIEVNNASANHIYANRSTLSKATGFVMTFAGLTHSLNLNGVYIGADKLGHFFSEGYTNNEIYNESIASGLSIQASTRLAMDYSKKSEEGAYGFVSTGIKSYADIAANYSGFLFWASLSKGPRPYFKCVQNKWVKVRTFDFKDYVSASWDEAINCNTYVNQDLTNAVIKRQTELEEQFKRRYTCPVAPNQCVRLKNAYQSRAADLLSPACLNATDPQHFMGQSSAQISALSLGRTKYYNANSSGNVGGSR